MLRFSGFDKSVKYILTTHRNEVDMHELICQIIAASPFKMSILLSFSCHGNLSKMYYAFFSLMTDELQ